MKIKEIELTPELADAILKKNTRNRPVNFLHVNELAKEMSSGRWKKNGETIKLNGDVLIDGQHRLHAVKKSGVTIQVILVEGVPYEVFDTIDVGKRRSAGDTLSVAGEANANRLAAALVMVDKYITGRMQQCVAYSNTDVRELLGKYPEVRGSIQTWTKATGLMPPSVLDSCHYLFACKEKSRADEFAEKVIKGISLAEGDPWYVLRERLVSNSLAKAKLSKVYIMALCIKAWNHSRAGAKVKCLKFAQEGANSEVFPMVR